MKKKNWFLDNWHLFAHLRICGTFNLQGCVIICRFLLKQSPLKLLCKNSNTVGLLRLIQQSVSTRVWFVDVTLLYWLQASSQGYSRSKFKLFMKTNNRATPFSVARQEQMPKCIARWQVIFLVRGGYNN